MSALQLPHSSLYTLFSLYCSQILILIQFKPTPTSYLRHDVLHFTASLVSAVVVAETVQHLLVLKLVFVRH